MPQQSEPLLERLLSRPDRRKQPTSLGLWHSQFKALTHDLDANIDKAILGGRMSHTMGYAFASGYQSAIQALFKPTSSKLASLCVTEKHAGEQGNHPRAIKTTFSSDNKHYLLNGSKSFITGASSAEFLYIACTSGEFNNERPVIKMLGLPADLTGIEIVEGAKLPFVPEVSHGSAIFEKVIVNEEYILAGDGYLDYIKPFRTIEDIHVFAAVLGYLLGEALDSNWQQHLIESCLSLLISLQAIANLPAQLASTHIALAGCRNQMDIFISEMEGDFEQKNSRAFAHWLRDKPLLEIAKKAHIRRTEKAWAKYGY